MPRRRFWINLVLIILVVCLAAIPYLTAKSTSLGGSDDRAKAAITELNKNYKPWFSSLWNPPGKESEAWLFALQAALGAGVIGYCLGYMKGKSKR